MSKEVFEAVVNIGGDIESFLQSVQAMQKSVEKQNFTGQIQRDFDRLFSNLYTEIDKVTKYSANNKLNTIDEPGMKKSINNIENLYHALLQKMGSKGVLDAGIKQDLAVLAKLQKSVNDYARNYKRITSDLEKAEARLTAEREKRLAADKE